MAAFDPLPVIQSIWTRAGLPLSRLPQLRLSSPGPGPALASSFKVAELAQITTALSAAAASYLHELRTGERLAVEVNKREAGLEFISEAWTLKSSTRPLEPTPPPSIWDPLAGLYKTSDSYVRVHTNFPHHRTNLLVALGFDPLSSPPPTRESVQKALLKVKSVTFETLATAAGCCVSALRSFDEWDASPPGRNAAERFEREGCVVVEREGEVLGAPEWATTKGRLAEGVKVLDMTRVIAGPIGGRTMATRGAQVLLVTSPDLPDLPTLDLDTTRGKRTTQLPLPSHLPPLTALLAQASIFLQSYRPSSSLSTSHLPPSFLRSHNPHMILASLSAYGTEGPWGGKRGFDSLVQTAMGFNEAEGRAFALLGENGKKGVWEPKALPVQGLDHAAGQLLAFGMLAGLCRQMTEGSTYTIRVSLISVAYLLRSLGRYSPAPTTSQPLGCFDASLAIPKSTFPPAPEIENLQREYLQTGEGEVGEGRRSVLRAMRHSGRLVNETGENVQVEGLGAPMGLSRDEARWV